MCQSKGLFGTGNDVILSLTGEYIEKCTVASHTDDQVTVLFGMGLGIQRSGSVYHVVLLIYKFLCLQIGG